MFFTVSKVGGFFVQPSNVMVIAALLGVVLLFTPRWRAGRVLCAVAAILLAVASFSPVGHWLILPLEQRFKLPPVDAPAPDGIVVLSGGIDTVVSESRGEVALNEAAERLTVLVALARIYPNARIVLSGGSGNLIYSGANEAVVARSLLRNSGLDPERLTLESRSRNTFENALYTRNLVDPPAGARWLLVTSAYHLPRAVGCFRRVGFDVVPYPVDFRTRGEEDTFRPFNRASEGLRRVDLAMREWTGLFVYWLTGRLSALFPGP